VSDTQKTTDGVREAPVASQAYMPCHNCNGTGRELVSVLHPERGYEPCGDCDATGKIPEAKDEPRYTVELTTEGWQIKDNVTGTISADVFGSKRYAVGRAAARNYLDDAEGQGRR
jgi:DnaJ-class molecular chaperone